MITPNTAALFIDLSIQAKVSFIAKQNSLMKMKKKNHDFQNKFAQFGRVVQV